MAKAKAKNKGGRPRIEIDKQDFIKYCRIQCTLEEIAYLLNCSEDTVERWCKRTFKLGFAESYKKHSAYGKMALRRAQYQMAVGAPARTVTAPDGTKTVYHGSKPNPGMAIWLGKQNLGQTDQPVLPEGVEDYQAPLSLDD